MRNSATIELIGYVYGEPENPMADRFPNFISFSLSVTKKWKDKLDQEQKEVTWYKCQSWSEGLSKTIRNYVKGGMGLMIKGTPKANAYIDKDGVAKSQIEVHIQDINMLTFPKDDATLTKPVATTTTVTTVLASDINRAADNGKFKIAPTSTVKEVADIHDDEIPF